MLQKNHSESSVIAVLSQITSWVIPGSKLGTVHMRIVLNARGIVEHLHQDADSSPYGYIFRAVRRDLNHTTHINVNGNYFAHSLNPGYCVEKGSLDTYFYSFKNNC